MYAQDIILYCTVFESFESKEIMLIAINLMPDQYLHLRVSLDVEFGFL